jgi:hypothetical protein
MILGLCDRFHCTPDVAVELDAGVIRLLRIEAAGRRPAPPDAGEWDV